MRKNQKTIATIALCFVLIAAAALTGCSPETPETSAPPAVQGNVTVLGEGATVFECTVADDKGVETVFEIHTDQEMVGEALQELGLLEGEEGDYGLYVKTVNGLTLDYETDGMYWGFYINGEYAMVGVDQTPIVEGNTYLIKAEAG